jgi:hypothetical protein
LSQTQINGGTQIRSGTITTTQLASAAGIVDGQLATAYVKADGTRTYTGSHNFGGFEATNLGTPTASSSAATKGYVDTIAQGLDNKYSARAATTGAETYTIASGSVTQINGTTIDSVTPNIGEYILVKDAPATSGVGSPSSIQPGNGLYMVTGNTTNLSLSRATGQSGSNVPAGDYVFIEAGSTYASNGWVVSTPSSGAAFTYGTGNIQWTQFTGAGEVTVDGTLTKTGNQLSRAALTGDVTASTGSNATTIAASAVTKMANLAANSVIGNATGSAAAPSALTLSATATASSVAYRDANGNLVANSYTAGVVSTATAAGTTTLTAASAQFQQFTGTTTQTVVLPNATTLSNGASFVIANRSTGAVTVNANGGGLVISVAANTQTTVTQLNNSSAAGVWDATTSGSSGGGSGTVTTLSVVSANGFAGSVANATTTPAITITTTATGLLKGNGTAISAATASTDYMAPGSFVDRETPSGALNGSNATYTLVNTPLSGTEHVYYNGILMEPGTGNDYTISGGTITWLTPLPVSGEKIRVSYRK